jgi:5'-methylthioadenosine phosphorylase/5'-methylthioinosine phosphorylase
MTELAIIGGSGLSELDGLTIIEQQNLTTPYGEPSASFITGQLAGISVIFLARHGNPHTIPPHKINYRANIWGLKQLGVKQIIAVAAVGGITEDMPPRRIAIPDQIIDYSYARKHTFFEDDLEQVTHVDFTYPYTEKLRSLLISAASNANIKITTSGVYGCSQGPRLETAAEISRMQRDGCNIVGMTGMPEAVLARELEIDYATCAIVANWAAGKTDGEISMAAIIKHLDAGMADVRKLLTQLANSLG